MIYYYLNLVISTFLVVAGCGEKENKEAKENQSTIFYSYYHEVTVPHLYIV